MQSLIELGLMAVAVLVFVKFAGLCKKFTLSAGFKKVVYIITAVSLLVLNLLAGGELQGWMVAAGLVMVMLFTAALMSETKSTTQEQ
ncbi:MAG: hypothetical protein QHH02_04340 [Syntrophomonadaceae bacterium]|nr:hypothetical protein [Syntrophomonadaceae bacterium]